jgi:hypothetical protein
MRRRRVTVDDAGTLRPHDHAAWFGHGLDELYAVAGAALADGLRRREKLIFVADAPDIGRLVGLGDGEQLLAQRQLELLTIDAVCGNRTRFSASAQLSMLESTLADALGAGFSGIRLVADNTELAQDDGDGFDRLLGWEQLADQLHVRSHVTSVCFFDRTVLSEARQADLAAVHPVRSSGSGEPPFSLFAEADAVLLVGVVSSASADRLQRLLATIGRDQLPVLDLCAAHLVDDDALLALTEVATAKRPLRVRAGAHLRERIVSLGAAGQSLRIEEPSAAEPRCARCGDVIGSYEQVALLLPEGLLRTSMVAAPERFGDAIARYHGDCYTEA